MSRETIFASGQRAAAIHSSPVGSGYSVRNTFIQLDGGSYEVPRLRRCHTWDGVSWSHCDDASSETTSVGGSCVEEVSTEDQSDICSVQTEDQSDICSVQAELQPESPFQGDNALDSARLSPAPSFEEVSTDDIANGGISGNGRCRSNTADWLNGDCIGGPEGCPLNMVYYPVFVPVQPCPPSGTTGQETPALESLQTKPTQDATEGSGSSFMSSWKLSPKAKLAIQAKGASLSASKNSQAVPLTMLPQPGFLPPAANGVPPAGPPRKKKGSSPPQPYPKPAKVTCAPEPEENWTYCMIKNIPNDYTQKDFLDLLDSQELGLGHYDFMYLPIDYVKVSNLGYAFVNFESNEEALRCKEKLAGYDKWKLQSGKTCEVVWGLPSLQSLDANIEKFRNNSVMHPYVPAEFQPLLFKSQTCDGKTKRTPIPFPAPTKKLSPPPGLGRNGRRSAAISNASEKP